MLGQGTVASLHMVPRVYKWCIRLINVKFVAIACPSPAALEVCTSSRSVSRMSDDGRVATPTSEADCGSHASLAPHAADGSLTSSSGGSTQEIANVSGEVSWSATAKRGRVLRRVHSTPSARSPHDLGVTTFYDQVLTTLNKATPRGVELLS